MLLLLLLDVLEDGFGFRALDFGFGRGWVLREWDPEYKEAHSTHYSPSSLAKTAKPRLSWRPEMPVCNLKEASCVPEEHRIQSAVHGPKEREARTDLKSRVSGGLMSNAS